MKVTVMEEHGYESAKIGISLSYNTDIKEMDRVAKALAHKGSGHSKFLESIAVWLDVDAPRYWWQQFDTYRTGMTKQSESTMHTMTERNLTQDDFSHRMPIAHLDLLNLWIDQGKWDTVKWNLPESFLQRRIMCLNYKSLQHIIEQRISHRLVEWQSFIKQVLEQVDYPYFLVEEQDDALFVASLEDIQHVVP